MQSPETFDFIIVGAGAAGCVLAGRLSEDPAMRILLIEAGPDHPPGKEHSTLLDPYPVSLAHACFSWPNITAEVGADPGAGKSRLSRHYLQGFGVGGGSNIQGMVALRGFPQDYNSWRDAGAAGWGWEDVLPYFRRLETDLDFNGPLHGQEGPIPIRRVKPQDWAPFSKAFADCARARGLPLVEDFNADFRAGVGPLPMASLPHRRVSASMAYLNATVRRRSNLVILTNALVERVRFQARRAVAVVARHTDRLREFAAREIILAAGALQSPAILMRSGIGPADHLREHGVEVVADLPGVGGHLMNHVAVSIAASLSPTAAQSPGQRGFGQSCLQLSSGVDGPEIDILLAAINKTSWHALGRKIGAIAIEVHKTHSHGRVRLRSADAAVAPEVKFNLLCDERDLMRLLVGLKLCLEIFADPRMSAVLREIFLPNGKRVKSLAKRTAYNAVRAFIAASILEIEPLRRVLLGGAPLDPRAMLRDEAALRQWAMTYATPPHHVSCTCRMGAVNDRHAVVDAHCRVFGLENLRVVDASIMPTLVRANTHVPVIMIAEKMAATIRSRA